MIAGIGSISSTSERCALASTIHQATLDAGERAGADYLKRTREMLASGGADPARAANLAYFLASRASDGISGRIISAVFDDWESLADDAGKLKGTDLYTLRRIDDMFYQEIPPTNVTRGAEK